MTPTSHAVGSWLWSAPHAESGRVVDVDSRWGQTVYQLWLPSRSTLVTLSAADARPLDEAAPLSSDEIIFRTAAARVAATLADEASLLAPLDAAVIPLPHQVRALQRAVGNPRRIRFLLADEVGLGKTIEAGLILRELKLRGLARRFLVVAPKGLAPQWAAEMRTHFGETFRLLSPGDVARINPLDPDDNPWRLVDQVIVPMDSVKPLEARRGWSRQQVADFNRRRFDDLILAGWDCVVVDEAHRLGGSSADVARYRLGQGLADAAPYLLLLSATPHQGKTDSFHRLMALLDPIAFPTIGSATRDRVRPYVIRTEKRRAIDADGQPLFQPRQTRLIVVDWEDRNRQQALLYESVTDYIRWGYNQARVGRRNAIGFLMLLMQRLVTSSTCAIRTTLERRLDVLGGATAESDTLDDDWDDLEADDQVDVVTRLAAALRNERGEVERLLTLARECEAGASDAKADALFNWIYQVQREEDDPRLKVLVFTEFVPTQEMLRAFLEERGISVVCLNGSMDLAQREQVQHAFAADARVLISTDAGGEGLNLQFCHVVVNYDIPWNPMRLEQRIGRVDRIGQKKVVRAFNMTLAGTVEHRVRDVLEAKLARILAEFGVDKAGDVLDSADTNPLFESIYADAVLRPETVETAANALAAELAQRVRQVREGAALFDADEPLAPDAARTLERHPFPGWLRRMAAAYARGQQHGTSPATTDAAALIALGRNLPTLAPGEPVPVVSVAGLPASVHGYWSLWQIALAGPNSGVQPQRQVLPVFVHDDGRTLVPTARAIWERLLTGDVIVSDRITGPLAEAALMCSRDSAESLGAASFDLLTRTHQERIDADRQIGTEGFLLRRRAIARLGLPEVREHRLARLAAEEHAWRTKLDASAHLLPLLSPIILLRIPPPNEADRA